MDWIFWVWMLVATALGAFGMLLVIGLCWAASDSKHSEGRVNADHNDDSGNVT